MDSSVNVKNKRLLRLLQTILRLKPCQIARAGKVSPAYVTRLTKGEIQGSDDFWSSLNSNILIEASRSIFDLTNNVPEYADELIHELKQTRNLPK